MKIDNKKLENFWYYHKNHVIIASVAIFLIVSGYFSEYHGKEADIYVSYINKDLTPLPSVIDLEKDYRCGFLMLIMVLKRQCQLLP